MVAAGGTADFSPSKRDAVTSRPRTDEGCKISKRASKNNFEQNSSRNNNEATRIDSMVFKKDQRASCQLNQRDERKWKSDFLWK